MNNISPNTPIWQLTVGEFTALLNSVNTLTPEEKPKRMIRGIEALAKELGVSRSWAQQIKLSGKINDAIVQDGRIILIDADKVIQLLKDNTSI